MSVASGAYIWLPCEVKPGPFSDERMVRVASEYGDWVGFVPVSSLEAPREGDTLVRALIVEVQGDRLLARIPGESLSSTLSVHALSCPEVGGSFRGPSYLSFSKAQSS